MALPDTIDAADTHCAAAARSSASIASARRTCSQFDPPARSVQTSNSDTRLPIGRCRASTFTICSIMRNAGAGEENFVWRIETRWCAKKFRWSAE